ncbi:ATP-binding protein [Dactylosporangium sp. CA-233914]|uniref:ATP-binding protein n=1 Tax=Dactylosporangium sp. CA-233914 TaxID=3239934 RepID=UPI003D92D6A5
MSEDDDWRVAYDKGIAALDGAALDEARQWFKVAVDSDAEGWEPYYAWAWSVLRDPASAGDDVLTDLEKHLDRALTRFGGGSDLNALRGQVAALRGQHERAVEFFLTAVARSSQREQVIDGLSQSLALLLAGAESGPSPTDGPTSIALCDRLETVVSVSALPSPIRDELIGEVVATRAFCRQRAGDAEGALKELRQLRRLVPDHPRLPSEISDADIAALPTSSPELNSEPRFASLGGIDNPNSFMSGLRRLFEVYLADADPEATRTKLAEFGQSPMRSLLLFGPSGCGKTYVVRAFSGEYRARHHRDLPIFRLKMDEVFGHYSGDGERKLTEVFDQALDAQPSIVFCDEVDAVGGTRERGEAWRAALTGHFLQQLDRVRERGAAVIFFGCTNRVWAVDLALIRRFDRLIPVELPDEAARREILQIHLARMASQYRSPDIDLQELGRMSHGLTPGDLQKLVSRATDDLIDARSAGAEAPHLTQEGLVSALAHYRRPVHVREWVRQSLNALRTFGNDDMAAELERLYAPYIGGIAEVSEHGRNGAWRGIPPEAWTEPMNQDLSNLRQFRRRS